MQGEATTPTSPFDNYPTRKIKFSEHPMLHQVYSLPGFETKKPLGILKRKHQSLFRESFPDDGNDVKQEFQLPFIQKRRQPSLKFKIEEPPRLPEQVMMMQRNLLLEQAASSIEDKKVQALSSSTSDSYGSRQTKVPVWAYILFAFCTVVIGGWIISRAFTSKIRQSAAVSLRSQLPPRLPASKSRLATIPLKQKPSKVQKRIDKVVKTKHLSRFY